jgi:inner membrane protein
MLGRTHFIAGAATATLVTQEPSASIGALLPDIDHPDSIAAGWTGGHIRGLAGLALIGAGLRWPSGLGPWLPGSALVAAGVLLLAIALLPHRGITHSLLALFAVTSFLPLPLALGYASHLVLDAISGGVPLLWPWRRRIGLRLVTSGGIGEMLAGLSFLVLLIGDLIAQLWPSVLPALDIFVAHII